MAPHPRHLLPADVSPLGQQPRGAEGPRGRSAPFAPAGRVLAKRFVARCNEITLITSLPLPPPGAVLSPLPCTAPSQRADATALLLSTNYRPRSHAVEVRGAKSCPSQPPGPQHPPGTAEGMKAASHPPGENRQGPVAGRVAAALNSACAAFTGNPRRLHGSGNQSPQVINCKGHKTSFFFFGSSSPRQPGLLSKNSHAATPPHKRRRHPLPAPGQHPTGRHGGGVSPGGSGVLAPCRCLVSHLSSFL